MSEAKLFSSPCEPRKHNCIWFPFGKPPLDQWVTFWVGQVKPNKPNGQGLKGCFLELQISQGGRVMPYVAWPLCFKVERKGSEREDLANRFFFRLETTKRSCLQMLDLRIMSNITLYHIISFFFPIFRSVWSRCQSMKFQETFRISLGVFWTRSPQAFSQNMPVRFEVNSAVGAVYRRN